MKSRLPVLLVNILVYWYSSQQFYVQSCNSISLPFYLYTGVHQVGVLSPILYNVFIDDLIRNSLKLSMAA